MRAMKFGGTTTMSPFWSTRFVVRSPRWNGADVGDEDLRLAIDHRITRTLPLRAKRGRSAAQADRLGESRIALEWEGARRSDLSEYGDRVGTRERDAHGHASVALVLRDALLDLARDLVGRASDRVDVTDQIERDATVRTHRHFTFDREGPVAP